MPNKQALRELYFTKRKSLRPEVLETASATILDHVISENLIDQGLLMMFLGSSAHFELPMEKWFEYFEQHQICVPKVVDSKGHMEAVCWEKGQSLLPNKWGILEPQGNSFIPPENIKTVIVPMLCFDLNGHRVGYGKGYYDRFLFRCATRVKTIGLSFYDPIESIEDVTSNDYSLDIAITPKKVYLF